MADEKYFSLEIISPERTFYKGEASFVELTTSEGEVGIYKNHVPMTNVIVPGIVTIHEADGIKEAAVHSGFMVILQDSIKIMAEVIGSELKVTILGTITDPEKSLVLESVKTGEIDFETEYRQNNSLPTGTYLLKQRGQLGYTCEVYKNVYRSGVLVDRVLVNNTKYDAASRIIEANPVP